MTCWQKVWPIKRPNRRHSCAGTALHCPGSALLSLAMLTNKGADVRGFPSKETAWMQQSLNTSQQTPGRPLARQGNTCDSWQGNTCDSWQGSIPDLLQQRQTMMLMCRAATKWNTQMETSRLSMDVLEQMGLLLGPVGSKGACAAASRRCCCCSG